MNRAGNADQAARTCERFVYSILKITRLYDYQTWRTRLSEKLARCAKVYGLLFLDCAFWVLIGWADKLRSRGMETISNDQNNIYPSVFICFVQLANNMFYYFNYFHTYMTLTWRYTFAGRVETSVDWVYTPRWQSACKELKLVTSQMIRMIYISKSMWWSSVHISLPSKTPYDYTQDYLDMKCSILAAKIYDRSPDNYCFTLTAMGRVWVLDLASNDVILL